MYFKIIFILLFVGFCCGDFPCNKVKKAVGYVCACNATYCDTISPPEQLWPGQFHFYSTSRGSPGFNHETGRFRTQGLFPDGSKYVLNKTKTFQKVRGFGGSFSDSFGFNLNTLSEKAQENLLRSYFSEDGIEYSVGRIVIGSSDFSLRHYSYVENYDPTLNSFNLTKDDYLYKIPVIKKAINMSNKKIDFLGTAWRSPNWMRIGNSGYLKEEFKQIWADYYVKTLDAFRSEGIEFWSLSTGNEPTTMFAFNQDVNQLEGGNDYSVVMMIPEEHRDWLINNLGPALEKSNYTTDIIGLDDMRWFAVWWMDTIMSDKRAEKYISGIGLHFYMDLFSSLETLDIFHKKYPSKEIVYTESSNNGLMSFLDENVTLSNGTQPKHTPRLGSWNRGAYYAFNIIENFNHWTTTYIDWNLALNEEGGPVLIDYPCDASIIINSTNDEFYKQPHFYIMGHFSKFIHPDATIIGVSYISSENSTNPLLDNIPPHLQNFPIFNVDVKYLAALNPNGSISVVFYNSKTTYLQIEFYDPDRGYASLVLEPESISTLLYW